MNVYKDPSPKSNHFHWAYCKTSFDIRTASWDFKRPWHTCDRQLSNDIISYFLAPSGWYCLMDNQTSKGQVWAIAILYIWHLYALLHTLGKGTKTYRQCSKKIALHTERLKAVFSWSNLFLSKNAFLLQLESQNQLQNWCEGELCILHF